LTDRNLWGQSKEPGQFIYAQGVLPDFTLALYSDPKSFLHPGPGATGLLNLPVAGKSKIVLNIGQADFFMLYTTPLEIITGASHANNHQL